MRHAPKNTLGEPKPINSRHLQIDDQYASMARGAQPIEGVEPSQAVRGGFDLATHVCAFFQQCLHEDAHVLVVIDDQHRDVSAGIQGVYSYGHDSSARVTRASDLYCD